MKFNELEVMPSILKALEEEGYQEATPIQQQAIPAALAGRDILASAQTGTGKTAAFAIPMIQLLCEADKKEDDKNKGPQGWAKKKKIKHVRTLIITPTRELAIQIYDNFCSYGQYTKIKACVIYGGVSQKPQEERLRRGVDVLIATPGRLADLMNQDIVDIGRIEQLVLDETDRMLDMGFIRDVRNIITQTPVNKQILMFSATFPAEIKKLAQSFLKNPVAIQIQPEKPTVDSIQQFLYYVDKANKADLLLHILKNKDIKNCLVFTRTKHAADKLVKKLVKMNISAKAIHGDKSQGARQKALQEFTDKSLRILVATDLASRGIDISELAYVVNYDLPEQAETYIHRIGRTGRAGLGGTAISFCCIDEKSQLSDIEKLLGKPVTVIQEHPYPMEVFEPTKKDAKGRSIRDENQSRPSRPGNRNPSRAPRAERTAKSVNAPKTANASKQGTAAKPVRTNKPKSQVKPAGKTRNYQERAKAK